MKPIPVIAVSFFFARWGDRLWNFAVGLYLVKLTPGSMQLAAIYGLVQTICSILFLPVIGDWIDRSNRLKAVRILLVLTNVFIILCAVCILLHLYVVIQSIHWLKLLRALIIILGATANLAGDGEKVSVGKDWVVVVCRGDKDMLANANASLRRIDLSVAILAPVGVGFLMTVVSDLAGIVFISLWCVITMFAEYFLLLYVYKRDPELRRKEEEEDSLVMDDGRKIQVAMEGDKEGDKGDEHSKLMDGNDTVIDESNKDVKLDDQEGAMSTVTTFKGSSSKTNLNFLHRLKTTITGWKVYRRQPVVLAGVSLAWLYFTSLGFNAITTSYAFSQGLKEVYISICYGLGSLAGISGTFLFPIIRNKIGLLRTGLVGNIMQVSMLLMCLISIWLPGSPSTLVTSLYKGNAHATGISSGIQTAGNSTETVTTTERNELENISIMVFMAGLILSRAGLWIADLTITQLQQENVSEEERGAVGGVQNASNSVFNLIHYIFTICLPYPRQFWILILMSIFAVLSSFVTYLIFNFRFSKKEDYERLE